MTAHRRHHKKMKAGRGCHRHYGYDSMIVIDEDSKIVSRYACFVERDVKHRIDEFDWTKQNFKNVWIKYFLRDGHPKKHTTSSQTKKITIARWHKLFQKLTTTK